MAPAPIAPAPEPVPVAPPQPAFVAPAPVAVAPNPFVMPPAAAVVAPPAQVAPAFVAPAPAPQAFVSPAVPAAPSPLHVRTPGAMRPPGPPGARTRGEDLIADLFEAMHDLHFLRDAIEGGDFCLTLAMEKLPSQAGIVHLYDIDRREFLVTNTRGAGSNQLLLRRHPENDAMLAAAMRNRRALVLADAAQSEAATVERYAALGGARSLIVAPVMQAGRFLGALELLNPLDGQPFTDAEGNALSYIAEQLAEFVGERGIVTDADRISRSIPS
jgi:hypothetical protein